MDYKTELQNNNIDLNAVLATINALPDKGSSTGGTDTSDATITSGAQMLKGITAYGPNGKITGAIESETAKTITPTKSTQTAISAGKYASGTITVGAIPSDYITTTDANATASDIAKDKIAYVNGVKITGTHTCSTGGGTDTSDATATAEDILLGETAYGPNGKITGTMVVQSYYVSTTAPSNSLGNDGDLCLVRGE